MQNETPRTAWMTCTTLLVAASFLIGCGTQPIEQAGETKGETTAVSIDETPLADTVLKVASTTSTRDSGLLDILLPEFEKASRCRVDLIAVGTGAALKLGEAGDVDAILVHARSAEEKFMDAGHGVRHEPFMHNFFIVAGPPADPAAARGSDAVAALRKIADGKHRFVSRGDDSGTHKREQSLWQRTGGRPEWNNFVESGQGMGPTLTMADEMNAYVLTDEGTWLKQSEKFQLVPLVRGADDLKNPYSVIVVNPDRHPDVNSKLASKFADFLISERAQQLIANYEINGQRLFHADRFPEETTE
ncbi:MAG: tungstate transport system substrate-binding protein [Planctomycetaceae bacterium]|jgi:tungstate transport system substrate-binding protein